MVTAREIAADPRPVRVCRSVVRVRDRKPVAAAAVSLSVWPVHAESARARSLPAAYAPHSLCVIARASTAPEFYGSNGHHGEHE